jgi:hypothetical protein
MRYQGATTGIQVTGEITQNDKFVAPRMRRVSAEMAHDGSAGAVPCRERPEQAEVCVAGGGGAAHIEVAVGVRALPERD